MKVYVIGRWEDRLEARALMDELKKDGHEITFDWTHENANALTREARRRYLELCAAHDKAGVLNADAVVCLFDDRLCGGLVELGLALSDGSRTVLMVGQQDPVARRIPIFAWLPQVRWFETKEAARYYLKQSEKTEWE